jgi:branched-chain amino acid transport system substrate-binding protein
MLARLKWRGFATALLAAASVAAFAAPTQAQTPSGPPIAIGFGMALSGPLAGFGKQALLGMKIWEEETNAKGGLLGRPVKLVYYDDQSNPSTVPGIYTKLLDVDKVDLVLSGYATNMVAPAVPVVMQKGKTFISLFALDANAEFKYPKYFSVLPAGPRPKAALTDGFFQIASAQNPKPATVALAAEDAEFSRNACDGARENSDRYGFKIIYDKSYPPNTTDYTPIVRALQTANADLVVVCSYPLSSVGMVLAANELNLKPKMFGGAMVGLQGMAVKSKLGPKLNGIINYETWVPSEKMMAPAAGFFKKYQARAAAEGADPLGYYLGGWGNAYISVLGEAVSGAKSTVDDKVADYLRNHEFKTIMGNWRYGANGEWTKSGFLEVQYHDIAEGAGLETWRGMSYQTVLTPEEHRTGNVIYPYEKAK